ncbi:MAG: phage holin family protein [Desulfobacterales bacterium]|nr:phage holin family protein [Desulfobacterales bacterium]
MQDPICFKQMLFDLLQVLPVLLLSAIGGGVAYLNSPKKDFSWVFLFISLITAAFVGFIVHCLLQSTSFTPGLQAAIVAVSGYASRDVLVLLKGFLLKQIKKRTM